MERRGEHFTLYVEDQGGAGTFNKMGSARANSFTINGETVDVTDKDSAGFRKLLQGGGVRSMSLSASGPFDGQDIVDRDMQAAALSQNLITIQMRSGTPGTHDTWQFSAQVPSYERNGEYNSAEMFSISFESSGTILFTAGTSL